MRHVWPLCALAATGCGGDDTAHGTAAGRVRGELIPHLAVALGTDEQPIAEYPSYPNPLVNALDTDPTTAWIPAPDATAYMEFFLPVSIDSLALVPGCAAGPEEWSAHGQVTKLRFRAWSDGGVSDWEEADVAAPAAYPGVGWAAARVPFTSSIGRKGIRGLEVAVGAHTAGRQFDDACISTLTIFGQGLENGADPYTPWTPMATKLRAATTAALGGPDDANPVPYGDPRWKWRSISPCIAVAGGYPVHADLCGPALRQP